MKKRHLLKGDQAKAVMGGEVADDAVVVIEVLAL